VRGIVRKILIVRMDFFVSSVVMKRVSPVARTVAVV